MKKKSNIEDLGIGLEDFWNLSKRNLANFGEKWMMDLKFPRLTSIN